MEDRKKYKLKGHETFCIREGWLAKGIQAVKENAKVFSDMYGADALGVGSNMAKAVRYWLKVVGLTEELPAKGVHLSDFGQLIYEKDAYFEELFTLWCLHINLVQNRENATVWYLFFGKSQLEEFTREELEQTMLGELYRYTGEEDFSERSLRDDCSVLLQMYAREGKQDMDPEDKKICPLTRLGLLRKNKNGYQRTEPDLSGMGSELLCYLLLSCYPGITSISMEEFYQGELGVGRVLGIGLGAYQEYLEGMVKRGWLDMNRTAGLDMLYPKPGLTTEELLREFWER